MLKEILSQYLFAGTDCRLIEIGQVAAATGGAVNIVEGSMLGDQLKLLMAEQFVATQVAATLIAHRSLYWYSDMQVSGTHVLNQPPGTTGAAAPATGAAATEGGDAAAAAVEIDECKKSRLEKMVGNVGKSTILTFRFGNRGDGEIEGGTQIPFQV